MSVAEEVIARYLARRDVLEPADRIVLMGSAVLESVATAAELYHQRLAPRILISGGIGHSTQHLEDAVRRRGLEVDTTGRPESHVFRELLISSYDVPPESIVVEDRSTNCGENAEFTRRIITRPERLLLIQDPTMQRRTHACFERSFADLPGTRLISHAPVIPWIGPDHVSAGPGHPAIWSRRRFTSLLLGEIRRLRDDADGYGPHGRNFIDHVAVPDDVLAAYNLLAAEHPDLIRQ
ncbi:YdcF family protein [Kribbella sp. NPDC023972]|uniref:YdcF family protein n=1 Tax=Kribbella sp. NPDC023972 TaxID=3154795 RepID=UPI00340D265D